MSCGFGLRPTVASSIGSNNGRAFHLSSCGISLSATWAVAKLRNRRCIPRPGRHLHGRNRLGMVVAVVSGSSSPTANCPAIFAGTSLSWVLAAPPAARYYLPRSGGRGSVQPNLLLLVAGTLCDGLYINAPHQNILSHAVFDYVKPLCRVLSRLTAMSRDPDRGVVLLPFAGNLRFVGTHPSLVNRGPRPQ